MAGSDEVAGIGLTIVSNGAEKRVRPLRRETGPRTSTVPPSLCPSRDGSPPSDGRKRKQMAMVGDQLYADRMAAALYGIPGLMVIPAAPTSARRWCSSASGKCATGRSIMTGEGRHCERV